jgi:hypothetical protein
VLIPALKALQPPGFPCPCFLRTFISFSLQLAVAVDANHLISSAQLHVNLPAGNLRRSATPSVLSLSPLHYCGLSVLMQSCSAFSSPDIAAVGEVGAVGRLLAHMQPR